MLIYLLRNLITILWALCSRRKVTFGDAITYTSRVWPDQIDYYFHMNNSQYLNAMVRVLSDSRADANDTLTAMRRKWPDWTGLQEWALPLQ